jgi:hypothetical protein
MASPLAGTQLSLPETVTLPARARVTPHDACALPCIDDDAPRAALERRLRLALGGPVALAITDNRRTMVSLHRHEGVRRIRLHHMFLDAGPEVIGALGRYFARGDHFASRLLDRFIAAHQERIRVAPSSTTTRLEPRGVVYDLDEMQSGLSSRYFGGQVRVDITWGRFARSRPRARTRRTIRMGTYFIDEQLIRIHPALDQATVPRYFVEWVIYHEMLHHVVPMPIVDGRRVYHSAEFRARERAYEHYERARHWEDRNLRQLIASRRVAAPR